ncbi:CLUMA_CG014838, isoform A [Clunio marinus]|uniref:CLUMA_CG014838, isoform A n=1 Tax=Clunio marinus TaxID=568069 RepID=A0A1J1IRE0_9DIPT|nr:CLUMA_CG014838, isoform A [Clunio marinus]
MESAFGGEKEFSIDLFYFLILHNNGIFMMGTRRFIKKNAMRKNNKDNDMEVNSQYVQYFN